MKRLLGLIAVAAALPLVGCSTNTVAPAPLKVGETVSLQGIEDQNGHSFAHQETMRTLLYVDGMSAKDLVRDSIEQVDKSCLESGTVVYLANISGMPSLISSMIAIPKMRDYDYPIWLDRDGNVSAALPVKEDQVSLVSLDQQVIKDVRYIGDSAELTQQLNAACRAE